MTLAMGYPYNSEYRLCLFPELLLNHPNHSAVTLGKFLNLLKSLVFWEGGENMQHQK